MGRGQLPNDSASMEQVSHEKSRTMKRTADAEVGSEHRSATPWEAADEDTKTLLGKENQIADECWRAMRKKLSKADRDRIGKASAAELESLMNHYIGEAAARQDDVKFGQGIGAKTERGILRFLDNFSGYVQAYSGVVSIMKGAGFGYGESAYGALQLFLIVAVHKAKTEDFIEKMLIELRQHYHRLQMLKDVYLTERMQGYVAVLYRLGVQFLYETVRYYSMGMWRRAGHLIARPPSIGVQKKVDEIKDAIRETEREMRALDGLRLEAMEREQQKHGQNLEEVSKILNAQEIRTDNDRLDTLRLLLHLDIRDVEVDANKYELRLKETFCSLRRLPPLDVDRHVFEHPDFISWRTSNASEVFLLHGATVAPYQTAYSWVSPAAARIVSDFDLIFNGNCLEESATLLTFSLHQCSDTIDAAQEKISPFTVIASIIYQLLRSTNGKRILRNEQKYAFLKQCLEALEETSSRQVTERCRTLSRILGRVLMDIDVKCLVIVVDRIDKFQGGVEKAVDILVDLMESTKVTIKLFLTARSRAALDDADMNERLEGRFRRLTLNQDG